MFKSLYKSQSLTLLYTAVPCSVVAAGGRVMNAWARSTNAKYNSPLPSKKKSLTVCKDKGKNHFVKDCREKDIWQSQKHKYILFMEGNNDLHKVILTNLQVSDKIGFFH